MLLLMVNLDIMSKLKPKQMKFKKIIVPIDFSEHSDYALEAASILAKKSGAEILALHMLELSDSLLLKADDVQNEKALFYLKLAEKRFSEFLQKSYLKGVKVTPMVKHYKVFSEVSQVAEDHSVDLIVMGSHGTSGFSELFMGSNTERVVRNATLPVLVIKKKPKNLKFDNIVYACNFSKESKKVYKSVTSMFATASKMHLLHVNVPNDNFRSTPEIEAQVKEFLVAADGNTKALDKVSFVADYTVENGVVNFAARVKADLIILSTHGRTGIAHFFEGSITEDIANHASIPVMTFKI